MKKNSYGKEFLSIANYGFSIATYVEDKRTVQLHCHDEIEILYILNGSLEATFPEGSVMLNEGEAIVINNTTPHGSVYYPGAKIYMCRFNLERFMDKFANSTESFSVMYNVEDFHYFNKEEAEASGLKNQLETFEKLRYKESEFSIGLIYMIIGILKEQGFIKKIIDSSAGFKAMLPIIEYINEHYDEEIMVKKLAEIFNYDKDYLSRSFKKNVGKTIIEYLNELRISKAKPLLATTNMSITEIAMQLGFSTSTYFIRIFKKYNVLTPSSYRERIKNNRPIGYRITPEDYKWYMQN